MHNFVYEREKEPTWDSENAEYGPNVGGPRWNSNRWAVGTRDVVPTVWDSQNKDLDGFSDDAHRAMRAAPKYFQWWYTTKSLALVGVSCYLAFRIGRDAGSRSREND